MSPGDLAAHDVALVRADNPSPLTLSGTNTWVVGGWVVDPGPALDAHLDAVAAEVAARGGAEGIALTHDHADHAAGVRGLLSRVCDVQVVSAREGAVDGDVFGPLLAMALPGHSDDHLAFVAGRAGFTGDAVLGEGSVFVSGNLAGYLDGLRRLRKLDLAVLCPGQARRLHRASAGPRAAPGRSTRARAFRRGRAARCGVVGCPGSAETGGRADAAGASREAA